VILSVTHHERDERLGQSLSSAQTCLRDLANDVSYDAFRLCT